MNLPFAIAAALSLFAAAVHGGAGEMLVVKKLRTDALSPTPFGGPSMTKLMIRVTWHITTITFVVIGAAMATCAPAGPSAACRSVGRLSAISYAGFAGLALALAARQGVTRVPRILLRHPGPLIFVLVAALAWWGSTPH